MANFWENDPIVPQPGTVVSKSLLLPNAMPIHAGGEWWANDPLVEAEQPEQSAQQRYEAALEKYRLLQYPDRDPEAFRKAAVDRQDTLIPGITNAGPLAPWDATQLSQNGLFFGATDEMASGMDALGAGINQMFGGKGPSMGDVFAARQELEQARRDLGREQLAGWAPLAEIAGGLATGGAAAKGAAAVGSQVPGVVQTAKGLLGAGASGAAYGAGATDGGIDDRALGAGIGAAMGVGAGVAAPMVARGVQKMLAIPGARAAKSATQAAINTAPPAAAIKASSKASYKAAERTGAVVDGSAINLLSHDVRQLLADEGILLQTGRMVGGYPKLNGALAALDQFGANGSMTVKQAMTLNRTFRNAAKSNDPAEAAIGMAMTNKLDDFFENLPVQAFSTNGRAGMDAVKLWGEARKDWARFKKTSTIEKAIYDAGLHKEGFASGLRGEFVKILKSDKKRRGFADVELSAMERYVQGGSVKGFLEDLSSSGSIPASVLGLITGGPIGAFAAGATKAGAGKLARGALDRGAEQAADAVRAQAALPKGLPLPARVPPKVIDGTFRTLAVNASNPGMDGNRKALADLLHGYRVPR